jgi:hypothetical protein
MKRARRVPLLQPGLFPDETPSVPLPPAVVSEVIKALADLFLASAEANARDGVKEGGDDSEDQC